MDRGIKGRIRAGEKHIRGGRKCKNCFCIGLSRAVLISLLAAVFLTACGKEEEREIYYDIEAFTEQIFAKSLEGGDFILNTQFYQDEPVQVWGARKKNADGQALADIWILRPDGGSELMLEGIDGKYCTVGFFLDGNGNSYIPAKGKLVKLDSAGQEVYTATCGKDAYIHELCQLPDGTLAAILMEGSSKTLATLNPDTGEFSEMEAIQLIGGDNYLGTGKEGLYLLDETGFLVLDLENGTGNQMINFSGMSYQLDSEKGKVKSFRVLEGEKIELLKDKGDRETLALTEVGRDRIILKLRTRDGLATWFTDAIVSFNRKNEKYYVVLDEPARDESLEEFITRTGMQLAAGKCADIIMGNAVWGDVGNLIDKGVFEELSPYLENSGVDKEDFFENAFRCWSDEEAIYGVLVEADLDGGYTVDTALFGNRTEITLEELLDGLLAYEGDTIFRRPWWMTPEQTLAYFLQGSENFWGMIDWEKGTCDFHGELFRKMMEAARRFGIREMSLEPVKDTSLDELPVMAGREMAHVYDYVFEENLDGRIVVGYFFDDGCHACMYDNSILGISAKSAHKDGAWEFITYLLGQEAQESMSYDDGFPVNRAAFRARMEREIEEGPIKDKIGPDGKVTERTFLNMTEEKQRLHDVMGYSWEEIYERHRITPERAEEIAAAIGEARRFPTSVEPMLAVIAEEAQYYFEGAKSFEEVAGIIENRVTLYLQERMD